MKKMLKKVLVVMICTVMVVPLPSTILANNNADRKFLVEYSGDGSDVTTKARKKTDNTYTYVRLDKGAKFQFACQSKTGIKEGQYGDPFRYDYSTEWHTLKAGKRDYFLNKAHKNGFETTYLSISSSDHKPHTYKGYWSPDNLSGYGKK